MDSPTTLNPITCWHEKQQSTMISISQLLVVVFPFLVRFWTVPPSLNEVRSPVVQGWSSRSHQNSQRDDLHLSPKVFWSWNQRPGKAPRGHPSTSGQHRIPMSLGLEFLEFCCASVVCYAYAWQMYFMVVWIQCQWEA